MGNMPNTKVKDHKDSGGSLSLPKHDHPPKVRSADKPAPPSGG